MKLVQQEDFEDDKEGVIAANSKILFASNCICIVMACILTSSILSSIWLIACLSNNVLITTQGCDSCQYHIHSYSITQCGFNGYLNINTNEDISDSIYRYQYDNANDTNTISALKQSMISTIVVLPLLCVILMLLVLYINRNYHSINENQSYKSALFFPKFVVFSLILCIIFMFLILYFASIFITLNENVSICHENVIEIPIIKYVVSAFIYQAITAIFYAILIVLYINRDSNCLIVLFSKFGKYGTCCLDSNKFLTFNFCNNNNNSVIIIKWNDLVCKLNLKYNEMKQKCNCNSNNDKQNCNCDNNRNKRRSSKKNANKHVPHNINPHAIQDDSEEYEGLVKGNNPHDNNNNEIYNFLSNIGLLQYYNVIINEGFDSLQVLSDITDDELKNILKIDKLGHRKKLLKYLKEFNTEYNDNNKKNIIAPAAVYPVCHYNINHKMCNYDMNMNVAAVHPAMLHDPHIDDDQDLSIHKEGVYIT